jgi:hypothetical protein
LLLAVLSAVSICAVASPAAAGNVAASDNAASPVPTAAGGAAETPPVYPGAVPGVRPEGVGLKVPPSQVKAYSTSDDFATVQAWYRAQLKGAPEVAQPGMEKTEDAFLVGHGASGAVVVIQSFQGKTWILIGPPT